jgi:branched-chain amino acid aminotransferase
VAVVGIRRNHPSALDPAIKSCNLLNNILAIREAQAQGAEEALLLNDRGELAEGSSTNVFVVKDGSLRTPPLAAGILAGITREVLFGLIQGLGLPLREEAIPLDTLSSADEAFVTSSTREAMPIRSLDGRPLGDGRPWPVTARVIASFRAYASGGRG